MHNIIRMLLLGKKAVLVCRNRNRRIAKSLGTQASSLREGYGMESPPCAGRMPKNSLAG